MTKIINLPIEQSIGIMREHGMTDLAIRSVRDACFSVGARRVRIILAQRSTILQGEIAGLWFYDAVVDRAFWTIRNDVVGLVIPVEIVP